MPGNLKQRAGALLAKVMGRRRQEPARKDWRTQSPEELQAMRASLMEELGLPPDAQWVEIGKPDWDMKGDARTDGKSPG